MPEATIAARLRDIARAYEQGDGYVARGLSRIASQYSCNAVYHEFNESSEMSRRYGDLFDMRNGDQWWLWHHRSNGSRRTLKGRTDIRILMLCFAAAMAETGDL